MHFSFLPVAISILVASFLLSLLLIHLLFRHVLPAKRRLSLGGQIAVTLALMALSTWTISHVLIVRSHERIVASVDELSLNDMIMAPFGLGFPIFQTEGGSTFDIARCARLRHVDAEVKNRLAIIALCDAGNAALKSPGVDFHRDVTRLVA